MAAALEDLTLGGFLSNLRLRHLETVVLKLDSATNGMINRSNYDYQVYFELNQSEATAKVKTGTDRPILCSELLNVNSDSSDGTFGRDLRRPPTLPSLLLVGGDSDRHSSYKDLHRRSANSLCRYDCVATDDSLPAQMSAAGCRLALRLKGIYFLVNVSKCPAKESRCYLGVELATSRIGRVSSYNMLTLRHMLALDMKSIDVEVKLARLKGRLESRLAAQSGSLPDQSTESLLTRRVLENRLKCLATGRQRLAELRQANAELVDCLASVRQAMQAVQDSVHRTRASLVKCRSQLQSTRLQLTGQRSLWLKELASLFSLGSWGDSIAGVSLKPPRSGHWSRLTKHEQKFCAAAFGLTAQLVALTGAVMDCPLRYSITLRGSKSRIRDNLICKFPDPPEFPLYHRGSQDGGYFNRAVLLLNFNVYGLSCNSGVSTPVDLRATALKNLCQLFDFLLDPARAPAPTPPERIPSSNLLAPPPWPVPFEPVCRSVEADMLNDAAERDEDEQISELQVSASIRVGGHQSPNGAQVSGVSKKPMLKPGAHLHQQTFGVLELATSQRGADGYQTAEEVRAQNSDTRLRATSSFRASSRDRRSSAALPKCIIGMSPLNWPTLIMLPEPRQTRIAGNCAAVSAPVVESKAILSRNRRALMEPVPGNKRALMEPVPGNKCALMEPVPSIKRALMEPVPDIKRALMEPVLGIKRALMEPVLGIKRALMEPVPSIKRALMEPVPGIKRALMEPVPGIKRALMEPVPSIKRALMEPVPGIKRALMEPVPSIRYFSDLIAAWKSLLATVTKFSTAAEFDESVESDVTYKIFDNSRLKLTLWLAQSRLSPERHGQQSPSEIELSAMAGLPPTVRRTPGQVGANFCLLTAISRRAEVQAQRQVSELPRQRLRPWEAVVPRRGLPGHLGVEADGLAVAEGVRAARLHIEEHSRLLRLFVVNAFVRKVAGYRYEQRTEKRSLLLMFRICLTSWSFHPVGGDLVPPTGASGDATPALALQMRHPAIAAQHQRSPAQPVLNAPSRTGFNQTLGHPGRGTGTGRIVQRRPPRRFHLGRVAQFAAVHQRRFKSAGIEGDVPGFAFEWLEQPQDAIGVDDISLGHAVANVGPGDLVVSLGGALNSVARQVEEGAHVAHDSHSFVERAVAVVAGVAVLLQEIVLDQLGHLQDGKCLRWASFLSRPQNTCTMPRVDEVTGSEKSPPGGDTAPTMVTEPSRAGEPRQVVGRVAALGGHLGQTAGDLSQSLGPTRGGVGHHAHIESHVAEVLGQGDAGVNGSLASGHGHIGGVRNQGRARHDGLFATVDLHFQGGEIAQHLQANVDDHVGVGELTQRLRDDGFAAAEGARDCRGAALDAGEQGVYLQHNILNSVLARRGNVSHGAPGLGVHHNAVLHQIILSHESVDVAAGDVAAGPDALGRFEFPAQLAIRTCRGRWIPSKMEPIIPGPSSTDSGLPVLSTGSPTVTPDVSSYTWIVAMSTSRRIISPTRASLPTRTSSCIAEPAMLDAITTGPDTPNT
uniref:UV radiation resistance-associated gene protein n=1 Tax=Macrostomum lignano TaxID=282301 RepID=A0A1I8J7Y4_9PLAT